MQMKLAKNLDLFVKFIELEIVPRFATENSNPFTKEILLRNDKCSIVAGHGKARHGPK